METARSTDQQPGTVSEHAQLEKLERLEQEYLRLTRTQNQAEVNLRKQSIISWRNSVRTHNNLNYWAASVLCSSHCHKEEHIVQRQNKVSLHSYAYDTHTHLKPDCLLSMKLGQWFPPWRSGPRYFYHVRTLQILPIKRFKKKNSLIELFFNPCLHKGHDLWI